MSATVKFDPPLRLDDKLLFTIESGKAKGTHEVFVGDALGVPRLMTITDLSSGHERPVYEDDTKFVGGTVEIWVA